MGRLHGHGRPLSGRSVDSLREQLLDAWRTNNRINLLLLDHITEEGLCCTTLAYFVAHESHHRGSILLTLKQSGHAVARDVAYGIWDQDRR